nr:peptide deformylase [Schwartzia sp. (in: firmicutes)]
AEQLLARCIQHELDHLDGVLFIDIAKSLRQEAANE